MPKKPPITPRCSYKEGRQRCIKNATVNAGGIQLCGVHARVVAQAAQQPSSMSPISGLGDLAASVLDDLVHGRPIKKDKIASAINETIWNIGGGYAGYTPPIVDIPIHDPSQSPPPPGDQGQQRRRTIFDDFTDWSRARTDPEAAHRAQQLKAAKAVLGFGPAERVTAEVLKRRHRELVKKHHPDAGGSEERMREINAAADVISQSLRSPQT